MYDYSACFQPCFINLHLENGKSLNDDASFWNKMLKIIIIIMRKIKSASKRRSIKYQNKKQHCQKNRFNSHILGFIG